MKTEYWHRDFTWEGKTFRSQQEIIEFVEERFPELQTFIKEWFGDSGEIKMKTSGSTGSPKEIILRREHMVNSAMTTAKYFELGEHTKALLCLPLGYIAGRMMLVRSMVLGWQLDVIPPKSEPDIPKEKKYDFAAMVPLQLNNSLGRLKNIRTLIVGGGQMSEQLTHAIGDLKTAIYATYGMTETITHVALCPVNKSAGRIDKTVRFEALPGISFSLDQRQCLTIDAPALSPEKVITNDLVELHSPTSFSWLSRFDHVINSGGLKLIPELIESKFKALLKSDFFVCGIPDEVYGQRLVLVVEGEQNETLLDDLRSYQEQHNDKISPYEIPKEVWFIKEFSRTETGKIQRKINVNRFSS